MPPQIKRWLAPPVFPNDEAKTRRAILLNAALLTYLALALLLIAGDLAGGNVPLAVNGVIIVAFAVCLVLRRWAYQGRMGLAGGGLLALGLVSITLVVALMGTIRVPAAGVYMLLVIAAGLLFDRGGLIIMTGLCALAVAGLIVAENAGVLPRPDYSVTLTQWITYTALFAWMGSFTLASLRSLRQALTRANQEITDRKRAEGALQKSERQYRSIIETTMEGVWIIDANARTTFANPRMAEMLRYSVEEMLGKPLFEFMDEEGQQLAAYNFERRRQGIKEIHDFKFLRKDGSVLWALLSTNPLTDDAGQFQGALAMVADITDRKQAEAALRESEEVLKESQVLGKIGSWELDLATWAIKWSDETYKIYERAKTAGPPSLEDEARYYLPEVISRLRELARLAVETGEDVRYDFTARMPNGKIKYLSGVTHPVKNNQGQVFKLIGAIQDITARQQAEEALKRSEAHYHLLADHTTDTVWLLDLNLKLTYVSPSVEKIRGYTLAELQQMPLDQTVTLASFQAAMDIFATEIPKVWADPGYSPVFTLELEFYRRDGSLQSVESKVSIIRDEQGKPTSILGQDRDITDRKRAEEALRDLNATLEQRVADRTRRLAEANAQLSELDRLKDNFISRISHELRTPLTSIIIYLDLLENGKPEKHAKYMQVLNEQAARLRNLIESLLEVTQQSGNAAGVRVAPTDLNHLAASFAADLAPRATECCLTLTTALAPDLPFAAADAISLAQVLSKLVANALNYTPAGGTITLSTAEVIDEGETWITFTIRDTGPGVAPDEQSHIFERFYRGRAAADYKVPGAGIGLAISRDLLTLMAGRLTVQSDGVPGHGAAFTAWLKPA